MQPHSPYETTCPLNQPHPFLPLCLPHRNYCSSRTRFPQVLETPKHRIRPKRITNRPKRSLPIPAVPAVMSEVISTPTYRPKTFLNVRSSKKRSRRHSFHNGLLHFASSESYTPLKMTALEPASTIIRLFIHFSLIRHVSSTIYRRSTTRSSWE